MVAWKRILWWWGWGGVKLEVGVSVLYNYKTGINFRQQNNPCVCKVAFRKFSGVMSWCSVGATLYTNLNNSRSNVICNLFD